MTRDQLYGLYRTYYSPGNAILVVTGDFQSDKTLARIRAALSHPGRGGHTACGGGRAAAEGRAPRQGAADRPHGLRRAGLPRAGRHTSGLGRADGTRCGAVGCQANEPVSPDGDEPQRPALSAPWSRPSSPPMPPPPSRSPSIRVCSASAPPCGPSAPLTKLRPP